MTTSIQLRWISIAMFVVSLGCSTNSDQPDVGTVTGIVTLDGKPVPGAAISFQPQGLRASLGRTDENGHYELTYLRDIKGAAVGMNVVRIDIVSPSESSPIKRLPAKYNIQSELQSEVKPGSNEINFDLKSE